MAGLNATNLFSTYYNTSSSISSASTVVNDSLVIRSLSLCSILASSLSWNENDMGYIFVLWFNTIHNNLSCMQSHNLTERAEKR